MIAFAAGRSTYSGCRRDIGEANRRAYGLRRGELSAAFAGLNPVDERPAFQRYRRWRDSTPVSAGAPQFQPVVGHSKASELPLRCPDWHALCNDSVDVKVTEDRDDSPVGWHSARRAVAKCSSVTWREDALPAWDIEKGEVPWARSTRGLPANLGSETKRSTDSATGPCGSLGPASGVRLPTVEQR